jgi:hypothetical protein
MSQPLGPHTALLFGLTAHICPHLPQFFGSSSLTQAPLQGLKPSSQAMPQPLAPQVARPFATPAQAVSQFWQCPASVAKSTHEPPQLVLPLGHSVTHLPFEHACSVAHGLSQPPQLAGLALVSMQAEPHSAKPWSQLAPHTPASHTAMPLAGASQTVPHTLQFWASVAKLTQAEPHKAKPSAQVRPHLPASHTALPLVGMGHAMPHSPQLSGLEVVSMHDPLQFMRPPEQPAVHLD